MWEDLIQNERNMTSFDITDRTSHLASRIISEVLYSSGET